MDIRSWVPQDKVDNSHIEQMKKLTAEEIAPIMWDLLEWTQDFNWPVSSDVMPVVSRFQDVALPHIIKILQPQFSDDAWKYNLICCVVPYFSDGNQEKLFSYIQRIAQKPTAGEHAEEADEMAQDFIRSYRSKQESYQTDTEAAQMMMYKVII